MKVTLVAVPRSRFHIEATSARNLASDLEAGMEFRIPELGYMVTVDEVKDGEVRFKIEAGDVVLLTRKGWTSRELVR